MAEIKIEKKKPVWPWVLVVAIIAIVAYLLISGNRGGSSDLTDVNENNSIVSEYVNYVEADNMNMSPGHLYASEAFLKLIDATEAMAREIGYDDVDDLDNARQHAVAIKDNPASTSHADHMKATASDITDVLKGMQKAKYKGLETEIRELENAVDAINPDSLAMDQEQKLNSFFGKAANVLRRMN